ncbi:PTS sugar transporter subunit IIA [Mycoplasmopsis cricetuli]|uniref:PTS sugar transporter subunit IIA n=1 Tax=Mycoplasmopsis cricetuli TaxID=171283 RepID=UPI00046F7CB4|nr:PTS sugar transporter subunit IIA [Mycoplasmopsis cricetuli]
MKFEIKNLINENSIFLNVQGQSHDEVLENICIMLEKNNFIENAQKFFNALIYRENIMSTALNDQIAVPHGISSTVLKPFVALVRLENEIDWNAKDNKPVKLLFVIGTSKTDRDHQIDILQMISLLSLDEQLIEFFLKTNDTEKIKNMIDEKDLYIY